MNPSDKKVKKDPLPLLVDIQAEYAVVANLLDVIMAAREKYTDCNFAPKALDFDEVLRQFERDIEDRATTLQTWAIQESKKLKENAKSTRSKSRKNAI